MENIDFEKKKLEYNAAQEMLRHYDSLNWQIGAILIAATILLTGLVLRKEVIDLIQSDGLISVLIVLGIPAFSFFILVVWLLWFRRHRDLYNFRNETLHRLEISLGMYHYLRILEAKFSSKPNSDEIKKLNTAKSNAGYGENSFVPFFPLRSSGPSGFTLAIALAIVIPCFQFILFLAIKCG